MATPRCKANAPVGLLLLQRGFENPSEKFFVALRHGLLNRGFRVNKGQSFMEISASLVISQRADIA